MKNLANSYLDQLDKPVTPKPEVPRTGPRVNGLTETTRSEMRKVIQEAEHADLVRRTKESKKPPTVVLDRNHFWCLLSLLPLVFLLLGFSIGRFEFEARDPVTLVAEDPTVRGTYLCPHCNERHKRPPVDFVVHISIQDLPCPKKVTTWDQRPTHRLP